MKKIIFVSLLFFIVVYYFCREDIYTFQFWDKIIHENNKDFKNDTKIYKKKKYQLIKNKDVKTIVNEFDERLTKEVQNISSNFEIYDEKAYNQPIYFQKIKIPDNSKVVIIGDIHSSLHSLFEILSLQRKYFSNNFTLKENHYIIFLGDFLDRGPYSIEILVLIFILKLKNFKNVYITQGNHENIDTNSAFGFKEELYNQIHENTHELFLKVNSVLNKLPEAIFVQYKNQFFMCCHGVFDVEKNYTYIKKFLQSENKYLLQKSLKGGEISGYKWNDINMNISMNTRNKRNTTDISESEILKYFEQTGISKIFKGHQDLEPCNICVVSGKENKYNLLLSKKYSQQKLYNPKQYTFDFFDKDLLAFITSTATQSKNVEMTSFLEIANQEIKVHLI